jgi:hypothetical protein
MLHPLLWGTINALPDLWDDQIVAGGPLALARSRFAGCAGHAKGLLSCAAHRPFALPRCDEPIRVRNLYLGRLSRGGGDQMLITTSAGRLSGLVATDVIYMLRCLATGLARSVAKSPREQWMNVPSTIWPQKWSCAPVPPCLTSETMYSWYVLAFGGVSGFSVSSTHRRGFTFL